MQSPDSPLNKLFDAARQEQSPLSEDDVRALLNQPQKQNRSAIMIPMLIAAAIITIAGVTSSVVLNHGGELSVATSQQSQPRSKSSSSDQQSQTTTSASQTATPTSVSQTATPTSASQMATTTSSGQDASSSTSSESRYIITSNSDNGRKVIVRSEVSSCANGRNMKPVVYDWQRDEEGDGPSLCQIKCVYPAASVANGGGGMQVFFATVRADREATDKLTKFSAPAPVLCTDTRGRACSPTDVAFFPSDFTAIAGRLNDLVPVTYAGREDILAWYKPSPELVQAFPDSLQDELETLLDIEFTMNVDGDTMSDGRPFTWSMSQSYNPDVLNLDSIIRSVSTRMNCAPTSVHYNDSNIKAYSIDMGNGQTIIRSTGVSDDPDSLAAFRDQTHLWIQNKMRLNAEINAAMINVDSTMSMLRLNWNADSLCKMSAETLNQFGVDRLESSANKKVYKIRKHVQLDTTVNKADSNAKHRYESRIIIKSSVKRNKNNQALPQVDKLSELTPTTSGAITSTSVYPNPATEGGATMSYVLSEPRVLTLTLLDLNGNVVATMMQNAKRASGNGQFAFTLENVPAGMYLATLTTDKGERAIQRLIVQ